MELELSNSKKAITLSDAIFACKFNEALVHQAVTAYLAHARAGTKAQKTRAEVRGGGAKPWRQKGTGRARAGTIRSPLWRKGGVIFAAKPRSFTQKINRKMYQRAMCSVFSELIRQKRMTVIEDFTLETHKTKAFWQKLQTIKAYGQKDKILIIDEAISDNLYRSARNLPHIALLDVGGAIADPVSLVGADAVLITEGAIKAIERLL